MSLIASANAHLAKPINLDETKSLELVKLGTSKDMIVYNTEKISGYTFASTPMFFDIRNLQSAE